MTLLLLPVPQPRLPPVQVQRLESAAAQGSPRGIRQLASEGSKRSIAAPVAPIANQTVQAEGVIAAVPAATRPRLDLDAAVKMAGKLARDPNSLGDDRAVAQLKYHPLEGDNPDSRLAHDMRRSARPDCLYSQSSRGLLAPLFLIAEATKSKKDGGCKW
ncbi:hypothetical protein [Collimonas pratensis]|nr:hypothetical protein [Collimonas pratensis]